MTPGFGHVSKGLTTAYGQGTSDIGSAPDLHRPGQRFAGAVADLRYS